MSAKDKRQILLTPGPLTMPADTRAAMDRDWGSRDPDFIAMTARILAALTEIAAPGAAPGAFVTVPVQGSGTFAVEAAIGTLIPPEAKTLVLVNGAYGARIGKIFGYMARPTEIYETPENTPPDAGRVGEILAADATITDVVMVHCETTSGILNPLAEIAAEVRARGRNLIVDAMSSFGALAIDAAALHLGAVIASANKCLESAPGVGFVVASRELLISTEGNSPSLSLDLFDQWRGFEETGQWRFTPPTHVVAALDQALGRLAREGGAPGRGRRYANNRRVLVAGMRDLGFETYLADEFQAPIIVTFHPPGDANFEFEKFYDSLKDRGCIIYPGKLTTAPSFRIGCIGDLDEADMKRVLAAVAEVMDDMSVTDRAPNRI